MTKANKRLRAEFEASAAADSEIPVKSNESTEARFADLLKRITALECRAGEPGPPGHDGHDGKPGLKGDRGEQGKRTGFFGGESD